MLKLLRRSWFRWLNDQSVHINEIFKGSNGMTFYQREHCINRRGPSTYSEKVSLLNKLSKSNITNVSICQCSIQILSMLTKRLYKSVSAILTYIYILYLFFFSWGGGGGGGGEAVGINACGLDDVFPPDSLCFVLSRMLVGASFVVCNNLLFLHYFNKLNMIFTY